MSSNASSEKSTNILHSVGTFLKRVFATRVVILVAIVAMISLSFISFSRIQRLNELSELVNHTHLVQFELQRTYSRLRDADGELHAFILTNDSSHYDNLIFRESRIKESIATLRQLTEDNLQQTKRLNSLDSLIKERYVLMQRGLNQKTGNYATYTEHILAANSTIREAIKELVNEENILLNEREESARQYKSGTPMFLFGIEVTVILFLFLAYSHVSGDLKLKAKLQRKIEQQRDFVRTILDNSVDVIRVVDRDLNLLAFNKRAAQLYQITDDRIGTNALDLFAGHDSKSHGAIQEAINGRLVHYSELTSHILPDRIFECFFIPLQEQDVPYAVLIMEHDITELTTASINLEKLNAELQRSNQELEQFAYVTSHDLQEPIRKIITYTEQASNPRTDKIRLDGLLTKIGSSAKRMSTLINDILNYSKVAANSTSHDNVNLNLILEQAKEDLELKITEKKASILSAELPTVLGSKQQLTQVFFNLIGNSIKFCERTPKIEITCTAIENSAYQIDFKDNGIGFEKQYEADIFQVFRRLNSKSEYSGSGIGLALCKRIIDNHGGSISASSEPGKGTTISILLPSIEHNLASLNERHLVNPATNPSYPSEDQSEARLA